MKTLQLIADTNVVSYAFRGTPLGRAYLELMGDRRTGVTGLCLAELRTGAIIGRWGDRKVKELVCFFERFTHVRECEGMAEVCGAIRGVRAQIGRPIDLPDAWAGACALWLDVPLVTHDRRLREWKPLARRGASSAVLSARGLLADGSISYIPAAYNLPA